MKENLFVHVAGLLSLTRFRAAPMAKREVGSDGQVLYYNSTQLHTCCRARNAQNCCSQLRPAPSNLHSPYNSPTHLASPTHRAARLRRQQQAQVGPLLLLET
jgi:hypothetical protein